MENRCFVIYDKNINFGKNLKKPLDIEKGGKASLLSENIEVFPSILSGNRIQWQG
ncbi:MAG: hypothetical protein LUE24_08055 [Lachnospiraceae bacterium]|nr:hypothetical protein [Lachnospiraceae bacterium]